MKEGTDGWRAAGFDTAESIQDKKILYLVPRTEREKKRERERGREREPFGILFVRGFSGPGSNEYSNEFTFNAVAEPFPRPTF